jgi:hypothetical protein
MFEMHMFSDERTPTSSFVVLAAGFDSAGHNGKNPLRLRATSLMLGMTKDGRYNGGACSKRHEDMFHAPRILQLSKSDQEGREALAKRVSTVCGSIPSEARLMHRHMWSKPSWRRRSQASPGFVSCFALQAPSCHWPWFCFFPKSSQDEFSFVGRDRPHQLQWPRGRLPESAAGPSLL